MRHLPSESLRSKVHKGSARIDSKADLKGGHFGLPQASQSLPKVSRPWSRIEDTSAQRWLCSPGCHLTRELQPAGRLRFKSPRSSSHPLVTIVYSAADADGVVLFPQSVGVSNRRFITAARILDNKARYNLAPEGPVVRTKCGHLEGVSCSATFKGYGSPRLETSWL